MSIRGNTPNRSGHRARSTVRARVGALVAFTALGSALVIGAPAGAQSSDSPAEKAAQEIAAARDRANAAADAWATAQSELDQLVVAAAQTEEEIAQLETEVTELQVVVEEAAINRFVTGSTGGIPLLSGLDGPNDQAQADVFAAIASDVSAEAFDDYDIAADELADKRAQLAQQQEDTKAAQEHLQEVQDQAYAEIENVRKVEEERLKDEAVRKALEAQIAEKQRQAEELARQQLAEQQAQNAAQAAANQPTSDTGSTTGTDSNASAGSSSGSSGTPTPPTAPPTAGGTTGGTTGATSGASGYVDGIACPVAGPSAFADTWGAPRSGGRRHEGVDMLGARGTPLVAVTSGYVEFKQNALGGNAVGLTGSNGNYYYYAHLDSYQGSSRAVTRGEVIGYMGDTGNAIGTPHLHFQIHPGGGAAVNPTPSVRAAC